MDTKEMLKQMKIIMAIVNPAELSMSEAMAYDAARSPTAMTATMIVISRLGSTSAWGAGNDGAAATVCLFIATLRPPDSYELANQPLFLQAGAVRIRRSSSFRRQRSY